MEYVENVRKPPSGTINTVRKKLQKRSDFTGRSSEELFDGRSTSLASEPGILIGGQYTSSNSRIQMSTSDVAQCINE